jgi:hypothetical protein
MRNSFKVTARKVDEVGYTLYKNFDGNGFFIAKSSLQYKKGFNGPVYYSCLVDVEKWIGRQN